jgi:hypothetical protein
MLALETRHRHEIQSLQLRIQLDEVQERLLRDQVLASELHEQYLQLQNQRECELLSSVAQENSDTVGEYASYSLRNPLTVLPIVRVPEMAMPSEGNVLHTIPEPQPKLSGYAAKPNAIPPPFDTQAEQELPVSISSVLSQSPSLSSQLPDTQQQVGTLELEIETVAPSGGRKTPEALLALEVCNVLP